MNELEKKLTGNGKCGKYNTLGEIFNVPTPFEVHIVDYIKSRVLIPRKWHNPKNVNIFFWGYCNFFMQHWKNKQKILKNLSTYKEHEKNFCGLVFDQELQKN